MSKGFTIFMGSSMVMVIKLNNMKFTGDFKKLKSYGFTFHKLFARNLKHYRFNNETYKIWIEVAGRKLHIEDLYGDMTDMVIEAYYKYKDFAIQKKKELEEICRRELELNPDDKGAKFVLGLQCTYLDLEFSNDLKAVRLKVEPNSFKEMDSIREEKIKNRWRTFTIVLEDFERLLNLIEKINQV